MGTNKVICITGMHRSGTSLFASWLKKCGLVIDDGAVVQHGAGNPKGLFEDKDFVDLHSAALLRQDPQSKGWIVAGGARAQFLSFNEQERDQASALVTTRDQKHRCWGWKDPRSVFFLNQWKQIIPELKVILLWRPAAEVVDSLERRSRKVNNPNPKIDRLQAIQLWRQENSLLCRFAHKQPADSLVLPISSVLKDNRQVFDEMMRKFQLDLTYSAISDVFDPEMFRCQAPASKSWRDFFNQDMRLERQLSRLSNS